MALEALAGLYLLIITFLLGCLCTSMHIQTLPFNLPSLLRTKANSDLTAMHQRTFYAHKHMLTSLLCTKAHTFTHLLFSKDAGPAPTGTVCAGLRLAQIQPHALHKRHKSMLHIHKQTVCVDMVGAGSTPEFAGTNAIVTHTIWIVHIRVAQIQSHTLQAQLSHIQRWTVHIREAQIPHIAGTTVTHTKMDSTHTRGTDPTHCRHKCSCHKYSYRKYKYKNIYKYKHV